MNREIKFRAWIKDQNRIIKVFGFNECLVFEQSFNSPCIDENFFEIENCILMQFTGLKDKNGVDIYDGDVLTITLYDNKWKTTVRDYYGTLVIDVEDCEWNITALSFLDDEAEIEVIGNIYENPELFYK